VPYEREHFQPLAERVRIRFRRDRGPEFRYSITLEALVDGAWQTIRSWDNAHRADEHHMHRHTRTGGQEPATVRVDATGVNDAVHSAIEAAAAGHEEMIRSWDW
jgi:hypothetical protein